MIRLKNVLAQESFMKKIMNIKFNRINLYVDSQQNFQMYIIQDNIEGKPENAVFTKNPKGDFVGLYYKEYHRYDQDIIEDLLYLVTNDITWVEGNYPIEKLMRNREDEQKIHGTDYCPFYYDMVLTNEGEWCFAPIFFEREEKDNAVLRYCTIENQEIEAKLLAS